MSARSRYLISALCLVGIVLLIGQAYVVLQAAGDAADAIRNSLLLFTFFGSLALVAAAVGVWLLFERGTYRPLRNIGRDIETLLEAKRIDRSLRVPEDHKLDNLPATIARLVDDLRGARREIVRAMATATARIEQEKGWLEVILLDLVREAVLVCSTDNRVLLYNQPTARLLDGCHTLGLGRPLFDVLAEAPVRHALEQLERRRLDDHHDLSAPFICGSCDGRQMLQARAALILDQAGTPTGYVLALADASAQMHERQQSERIRRLVTQDLRGPLGSLHAAIETLVSYPDLDEPSRRAFEQVVLNESGQLSERLESVAEQFRGQHEGHWPMTEIHSQDLLACAASHLSEQKGLALTFSGEPQWLRGDSYSLMVALEEIVTRLNEYTGVDEFEVEAGTSSSRSFIEFRWKGKPLSGETLGVWLEQPLSALGERTLQQVLDDHGSEPWSRLSDDGLATLRVPLQPPLQVRPEHNVQRARARPELYDFDLMYATSVSGEVGKLRLKDVSYVVFDTETTGLKPTGGDEIISIAAVRVTGGRVLESETFSAMVNPGRPIPTDSIQFHGITDEMVRDEPSIEEVLPQFREFAGDAVLVAHNAAFDMKFLRLKEARCGVTFDNLVMDTLLLSVMIDGDDEDQSLDGICERLNIAIEDRHSALGDAMATAHVLAHLLERLEAQDIGTFEQVMRRSDMAAELRMRAHHF